VSWVKLDDGFFLNRKVQSVSPMATLLDISAFCFCAQAENDGHFNAAAAQTIASLARVKPVGKLVAELLSAGLWIEEPGGYAIHDFLEYNPSHEQLEADRKRKRDWKAGHSRQSSRPSTGQSTGPSSSEKPDRLVDRPVAAPRPLLSSGLEISSSVLEADPDQSNPCAKSAHDWLSFFAARHREKTGKFYGQSSADAKASGNLADMLASLPFTQRAEDWEQRERMVAEFLSRTDPRTVAAGWPFAFFANDFRALAIPPERRPKPRADGRPTQQPQVTYPALTRG
jgi:hypothetical protein